jgi:amidohydrolase
MVGFTANFFYAVISQDKHVVLVHKRSEGKCMMDIKQIVATIADELVEMRRDFHAYPELGFEEHRTARVVEAYLQCLGIPTKRMAKTGVVGMIEGKFSGPVLMLRADLDALPVSEENEVDYCSKHKNVMHACGHDAHIAMLLGAAKILSGMRHNLAGSIKLVFQPNEEIAGALQMIEEGVLDDPPVNAAMGIHIWTPIPSGMIGVSAGAVMAGLEIFKITVKGSGGHTGSPETASDPIIAAADLVGAAQRIQTREISLLKPTVLMFGSISGGTKANIIPDTVTLEGSIRTLYADCGEHKPMERLKRIAQQVCSTHGCSCQVEWYRENIPLINDPELTQLAVSTASATLGDCSKVVPFGCMASEDFSEFSARVPGVFVFLGSGNEAKGCHYPHHNPRFNIDEDTLPDGVEMYVRFALSFLSEGR